MELDILFEYTLFNSIQLAKSMQNRLLLNRANPAAAQT